MKTTILESDGLSTLRKPKQKMTMLVLGGGMMGCDVRQMIVTRGELSGRDGNLHPCYSAPRAKKIFSLLPILKHGAILLSDHVDSRLLPVFEGDVACDGVRSFVMDGTGGRFVDYAGDGGQTLLREFKERLVLHTIAESKSCTLRAPNTGSSSPAGAVIDAHFQHAIIAALGEPAQGPWSELPAPPPTRKTLFTDRMLEQLREAGKGQPKFPLFRLFSTSGSSSWLVYSIDDDNDTLWVVADIGQGVVEYGTISLKELETTKDKFGLGVERDKFWRGTDKSLAELCDQTSLGY